MGEASNVLCLLDPQNSFTFEHPGDGGRELRSRRNLFNYWFEGGRVGVSFYAVLLN